MRMRAFSMAPHNIFCFANSAQSPAASQRVPPTSQNTIFVTTFSTVARAPLFPRQTLRKALCVIVVSLQKLGRFFERNEPRRCKDSRLPHAAAEKLAVHTRFLNDISRPDQHRAYGRA